MNKAHKFIQLQGSGSWVSSSIYTKGIESHLYGPGSQFPFMSDVLGHEICSGSSQLYGPWSHVPSLTCEMGPRSRVSGPTKSGISGLRFHILDMT